MALQLQKDVGSFTIKWVTMSYPESQSFNALNKFILTYETLRSSLYRLNNHSSLVPSMSTFEWERRLGIKWKLTELKISLNQMVAYFEGKLEALPEKLEKVERELTKLERESKALVESLNKFIQAEDFKVEPEKLGAFPKEVQLYLHEALGTYKNGLYIACCSMCGNILAGLVKDTCQRNNLKYKGLAEGIKDLKDAGVIKEPYKQLIDVAKYYRDHADHPTSEAFTKEKAKLFLSSLIIFIEEIFT